MPGSDVVEESNIRKVPLILNHHYVIDFIEDQLYLDLVESLLTGSIRTPTVYLISDNISRDGISIGYEGPGMLKAKDNKLTVQEPDNFIWAFKSPYIYGYKTKDGLELKENEETLKVIRFNDIANDTIPSTYFSGEEIKEWFENSQEGDEIVLDYYLTNFNDGRNSVLPHQVVPYFGDSVQEYMKDYPSGSPVMAYKINYSLEQISSSSSVLDSHPEFGDMARAYNAQVFAYRWNGTIIPPDSISSGKERGISFTVVRDPKAPGGFAAHGTCPPARALRNAVSGAGSPLPVGLRWGYEAVMFGFNPATDVKVTNTNEDPILILMWTSGSGGGTITYAQVFRLVVN